MRVQIYVFIMKKTILFCVTTLLLGACSNRLKIQGTVDPALNLNGKTVTLYVETDTMDAAYTTVIADNVFAFRQHLPISQVTAMRIQDFGNVDVVLEQGTIYCSVMAVKDAADPAAGYARCTGTPNNNLLTEFQQTDSLLTAQYEAAADETAKQAIEKEYVRRVYDFIMQNINTLAANYIFSQYYWLLDMEQCGTVLQALTPESLNYGKIPSIHAAWNAQDATAVGKPCIDFALPTPQGDTLALSSLVGNTPYILLDFWASWCGPCRASMPSVSSFYAKHQNAVQILGISLDKDRGAWTDAIASLNLKWLHVSDLQGWKSNAAQLYGINAIPATVLIDNQGIIVGRNLTVPELEAFLSTTE